MKILSFAFFLFVLCVHSTVLCETVSINNLEVELWPHTYQTPLDIPSPASDTTGKTIVEVTFLNGSYGYVSVSLSDRDKTIDSEDFPDLLSTGLHSSTHLKKTRMITGRSVAEITMLALPGRLSDNGFLAEDEDILSVIMGDNTLVRNMGLTHNKMAIPLFHVFNVIHQDVGVLYKNHSFDNILSIRYNNKNIFVKGIGTKGGQLSIFEDGIEGALDMDFWRVVTDDELSFLRKAYPHMRYNEFSEMVGALSRIHTGEMEPQYIMRYGFYEGHTGYRADPVAIAFVFGLKSIEEIEQSFKGTLDSVLKKHFVR